MNIRLQKYKKNRLIGMNQVNAAIAAGYPDSTARHHSTKIEAQAKIVEILERQGLTDKVLAEKHRELITAHEVVEKKDKAGNVLKSVIVENYPIQIKALELAYKIKNLLRESPLIDQSQHTHLHFIKEALTKSDMIGADGKFR